MVMASRRFQIPGSQGHRALAYTEWGDRDAPRTVVCVHGLTRNSRDFDIFAAALQGEARVICPDIVGRGASDWLAVKEDYGYPLYCADMTALISGLGLDGIEWVGTSMGGLIGMMVAAQPESPIRRLVMNDIGPFVPRAALLRIGEYVGKDPRFASRDEFERYLREIYGAHWPLGDAHWRHLADHSARVVDGGFSPAYDPAIGAPFADPAAIEDADLWELWDAVRCPVLVLRGADSDVLPAATAEEMTRRGPRAALHSVEGAGHPPMLMDEGQIALLRDWLAGRD